MTQKKDIYSTIQNLSENTHQYTEEAFNFILETLEYTVKKLDKPRHISAEELLEGMRLYALEQYGPMTKTVLDHWGIHTCQDFGTIVFILVKHGLIRKNEQDSQEDFTHGFSFEEAFVHPFQD